MLLKPIKYIYCRLFVDNITTGFFYKQCIILPEFVWENHYIVIIFKPNKLLKKKKNRGKDRIIVQPAE